MKEVAQLLGCTLGVYASFTLWSVLQERIATQTYNVDGVHRKFDSHFVLGAVQSLTGTALSAIIVLIGLLVQSDAKKGPGSSKPLPLLLLVTIGLSATCAAPFGYAALKLVSYPIVVTVKMCKMIPIMLVGIVWYRRSYSIMRYFVTGIILVGVLGFTLTDPNKKDPNEKATSLMGVVLTMINLVLDGFTNSSQDELVRHHNIRGVRMMLWTNCAIFFWSVVVLFVGEALPPNPIFKAELYTAINFFIAQPEALHHVVWMGCLNAVGQLFIFQTLSLFGSLTLVTITVTRKIFTVVSSIFIHNHVLAEVQWWFLIAVFVGVFLDAYETLRDKSKREQKHKKE